MAKSHKISTTQPHPGQQPQRPQSPSVKTQSSQEAFAVKAKIDQLKKQIESKVAASPEKAAKILAEWLSKKK